MQIVSPVIIEENNTLNIKFYFFSHLLCIDTICTNHRDFQVALVVKNLPTMQGM